MSTTTSITTWADFAEQAPDLAALAAARIEAHGLALLATLRADGAPRISGIEPLVRGGQLWFGMMPDSRKVADLERDPRFALHSATIDKNVAEPDVKLDGRAIAVPEASPEMDAYKAAFEAATGHPVPDGPINLFVADLTGVSSLRPDTDHLVIEWWHPGDGPHSTKRY
jgi:nitroimidazol reductase NimA-like FMN-containing flavoprotein (pyridoxamine 5'-phosphate oxidase superfamily)